MSDHQSQPPQSHPPAPAPAPTATTIEDQKKWLHITIALYVHSLLSLIVFPIINVFAILSYSPIYLLVLTSHVIEGIGSLMLNKSVIAYIEYIKKKTDGKPVQSFFDYIKEDKDCRANTEKVWLVGYIRSFVFICTLPVLVVSDMTFLYKVFFHLFLLVCAAQFVQTSASSVWGVFTELRKELETILRDQFKILLQLWNEQKATTTTVAPGDKKK